MRYFVLLCVLLVSGCATTQDQVASGLRKYCGMFTAQERFLFREGLTAKVDPGMEVRVRCPGDEPLICKAPE